MTFRTGTSVEKSQVQSGRIGAGTSPNYGQPSLGSVVFIEKGKFNDTREVHNFTKHGSD